MKIYIVFKPTDGSPNLTFVEVHNEAGESIKVGQWIADGDYEALILDIDTSETLVFKNDDGQATLWPLDAIQPPKEKENS